MWTTSAVFKKSAHGVHAMATRPADLTQRHRAVLVMVDGKRTATELMKLCASFGNPQELITQLVQAGYIEATESAVPRANAPQPQPQLQVQAEQTQPVVLDATALPPPVTLSEAKRWAVRRLTDLMGPNCETLCLRIEEARSPKEYNAAIERAIGVVRQFGGSQVANSFSADLQQHRPG